MLILKLKKYEVYNYGLWLLTVFFGNMITAYIAQVNVFEGGNFFMFFAALMAIFGVVFALIAKKYVVKDYMEQGDIIENPDLEQN